MHLVTYRTLNRLALSPGHVAQDVLNSAMFGGRLSASSFQRARLRLCCALEWVTAQRMDYHAQLFSDSSVAIANGAPAVLAFTDAVEPEYLERQLAVSTTFAPVSKRARTAILDSTDVDIASQTLVFCF